MAKSKRDPRREPELWDQLENEANQPYQAFRECYMPLPGKERTLVNAWREWSKNPNAQESPSYFSKWARDHAWEDRARAYHSHIDQIRRRGMERAIEQEAENLARQAERSRGRMFELLTIAYDRAYQWLTDAEWANRNLRPQDVIQIIKLHIEASKEFSHLTEGAEPSADDWTEEDDKEFVDGVLAQILAEREGESSEADDDSAEEEGVQDS